MGTGKYPTGADRLSITQPRRVRLRTTNGLERLNREIMPAMIPV